MHTNPFNTPLHLVLKPSLQKRLLIIAPHLIALFIIVLLDVFPLYMKIALFTLIVASSIYYSRLHIFNTLKKSIHTIQQDSANNWIISIQEKGDNKTVELLPSSFISKIIIVLNYKDINKSHYSAIITKDSLSDDDFRHLYVKLKLENKIEGS